MTETKELRSHLERFRKDTLFRKSNSEFSIPTPNKVGKELTCSLHTHQGGFTKGGFMKTGTELIIYYEEDEKAFAIANLNFMIKNHRVVWKSLDKGETFYKYDKEENLKEIIKYFDDNIFMKERDR